MRLRNPLALCLVLTISCGSLGTKKEAPSPAIDSPLIEASIDREVTPAPLDAALFERYVILGSSASAGFNIGLETGVPTRLADYYEAGLLVEGELVFDGSTEFTFLDPERIAGKAVTTALAEEPTLVIAVDFLFWFFYGSGGVGNTLEFRRGRLEAGFALLDQFQCTVLVGDLPNMAGAAGGMIPYASMPPADGFEDANARVREWAAAKDNVVVVPLAEFNAVVAEGVLFKIGDFTWDPKIMGGLLQIDELHPNLAGCACMALQILHSLAESRQATLDGIVITNPEDLADAVDDLVRAR